MRVLISFQQRTKLLTSKMGKGATLEMQFRWPAAEGEHEDPRYERLVLLLQVGTANALQTI